MNERKERSEKMDLINEAKNCELEGIYDCQHKYLEQK